MTHERRSNVTQLDIKWPEVNASYHIHPYINPNWKTINQTELTNFVAKCPTSLKLSEKKDKEKIAIRNW